MLSQSERIKIAKRVAEELSEGQIVNLGVGIPTLIPDFLGEKKVFLQSENGLLGMGPTPDDENVNFPSSGTRRANILVTEHAVFKFTNTGTELIEILSDISMEKLKEITGVEFGCDNVKISSSKITK